MNTFDAYLAEQLDLLVPRTSTTGDWQEVIRRATPRRRRRRIVQLATAGAIFAAGIAFAGAAGAGHWIFATPADFNPAPGMSTQLHARTLVAGKEWAVASFTNSEGKLCLGIKTPGGQGLSCTTKAALFSEGPVAIDTGWTSEGGTPASWIWGIAKPTVDRVVVQFADCSERSLALDDGFFLVVTPGPSDQSAPHRVTALNDGGQIIGTKAVPSAKTKSSACAAR